MYVQRFWTTFTTFQYYEANTILSIGFSCAAVYFNIYWIRGKMYQAQIKYRSKVNAEKTMENLDDAVEQYLVGSIIKLPS